MNWEMREENRKKASASHDPHLLSCPHIAAAQDAESERSIAPPCNL